MENQHLSLEDFVKVNYLKMSAPDMGAHFGCSGSKVKAMRKKLGLSVPLELSKKWTGEKNATKTTCSPADDNYIKENYLLKSSKKIALELKFSDTKVLTRMRQLGLVVPDEVKQQRTLDNRFKLGSVPVTKGMKQTDYMSAEAIERSRASRFKSGTKPINTLTVGSITTRTNYKDGSQKKWISRGLNDWVPLHIHVWESENGKVPAKHCVRFKDGNPLNCEADNLLLVSKKNNYRLNSLAGKGLTDEPRISVPAKRKPSAAAESRKRKWEDGLIRGFEKQAKAFAASRKREMNSLLKSMKIAGREVDRLLAAKNRQLQKLNIKVEKWEDGLIASFKKHAIRFAKKKAKQAEVAQRKADPKPGWEDVIIRKFEESAKRYQRLKLRQEKAAVIVLKKSKPKVVKQSAEEKSKAEMLVKIKREQAKMEAKRNKERERIERETKSLMPTRIIDESKLIPLRINDKTVVYIKPGVDPEVVRNKFLTSQTSRSQ